MSTRMFLRMALLFAMRHLLSSSERITTHAMESRKASVVSSLASKPKSKKIVCPYAMY